MTRLRFSIPVVGQEPQPDDRSLLAAAAGRSAIREGSAH
jgi:hypothetical protein